MDYANFFHQLVNENNALSETNGIVLPDAFVGIPKAYFELFEFLFRLEVNQASKITVQRSQYEHWESRFDHIYEDKQRLSHEVLVCVFEFIFQNSRLAKLVAHTLTHTRISLSQTPLKAMRKSTSSDKLIEQIQLLKSILAQLELFSNPSKTLEDMLIEDLVNSSIYTSPQPTYLIWVTWLNLAPEQIMPTITLILNGLHPKINLNRTIIYVILSSKSVEARVLLKEVLIKNKSTKLLMCDFMASLESCHAQSLPYFLDLVKLLNLVKIPVARNAFSAYFRLPKISIEQGTHYAHLLLNLCSTENQVSVQHQRLMELKAEHFYFALVWSGMEDIDALCDHLCNQHQQLTIEQIELGLIYFANSNKYDLLMRFCSNILLKIESESTKNISQDSLRLIALMGFLLQQPLARIGLKAKETHLFWRMVEVIQKLEQMPNVHVTEEEKFSFIEKRYDLEQKYNLLLMLSDRSVKCINYFCQNLDKLSVTSQSYLLHLMFEEHSMASYSVLIDKSLPLNPSEVQLAVIRACIMSKNGSVVSKAIVLLALVKEPLPFDLIELLVLRAKKGSKNLKTEITDFLKSFHTFHLI